MENLKKWTKINEMKYAFSVNEKIIGTLEVIYTNFDRKSVFTINNKTFTLQYNGFWKSNFEIEDETNTVILKTYTEKWYASSTILEYNGKKLKLKIRNNPLAEYVIFDGDSEVLAYGLTTDSGKAAVKITSGTNEDYLLDYLLWYVFMPIAQENIGDNYVFQTLLMNQ